MIHALKLKLQVILPGFPGLFQKEIMRFMKVSIQTIFGPVLSSVLFLFIFSHVLEGRAQVFEGVSYTAFLVPGLAAMTMIQQSFANASSSLIVSKMMGNMVMILLSPITPISFFISYMLASFVRGVVVMILVMAIGSLIVDIPIEQPLWMLAFLLTGGIFASAMGVITGIWAEKFDQIALFQTVILMPMTFLSGVFYSLESLPDTWQFVSRLNPFTYYIDGFRFGFVGSSDIEPIVGLAVTSAFALVGTTIGYIMVRSGYKLRN